MLQDELGGGLLLPQAAARTSSSSSSSSGLVSIVLSGAELAALDLSHLQLFWSSSSSSASSSSSSSQGGSNETRIELRRKSGVAVESPVIVPASIFELSRIDCGGGGDDSFAASDSAAGEQQPGSSKLRLFGSESSAAVSPIVLKSRAVIEAEKGRYSKQQQQQAPAQQERAQQAGWRRKNKQRAVSMDEASLGGSLDHPKKHSSSSKDDLSAILQRGREISSKASRPSRKSEPMPLPLPLPPLEIPQNEQGDEQQQREERSGFGKKQQQHRRHLSIDLRASPAAKFLVKVMPWEVPRSPSPLAATAAAEGTPQSCFVPFKWEEAPGKPKLLRTKDEERFFRHHDVDHQPPLRLPPRLQADLSHHKHHSSSLWPSIHARGHKTSSAIAAAAATSPTSILDAAATESTPSSCAASVSSPTAADETAARGKCNSKEEHPGGFCVIPPCEELEEEQQQHHGNGNSSSSIQGKLRAFFAWQVWQRLVLGKKKTRSDESDRHEQQKQQQQQQQQQQCESYDNFDELLQRNNRRKKKKKRRNRIRAPADHHSSSYKNGYNAQDYSLRSPSPMVFSWFASPLQVQQRDNIGQRAFTRIAASCNVLKKVVVLKRIRWCHHRRRMHLKPSSSRTKSIYRPLLCRVDADSAAFACSSSSTI